MVSLFLALALTGVPPSSEGDKKETKPAALVTSATVGGRLEKQSRDFAGWKSDYTLIVPRGYTRESEPVVYYLLITTYQEKKIHGTLDLNVGWEIEVTGFVLADLYHNALVIEEISSRVPASDGKK